MAVSQRRRGHTVSTTVTVISLHTDKPLQKKLMLLNIHHHSSRVARSVKLNKPNYSSIVAKFSVKKADLETLHFSDSFLL